VTSKAEQALLDAMAVLDALKPYQEGGRDLEELHAAWEAAWLRMREALDAYIQEGK
jgi:hypothetical protein